MSRNSRPASAVGSPSCPDASGRSSALMPPTLPAFCVYNSGGRLRGFGMTSGVTDTPRSEEPSAAGQLAWHTLGADQVLHSEGGDAQRGLSSAEAAARAGGFGPNASAAGHAEPRWHAFGRQYADP